MSLGAATVALLAAVTAAAPELSAEQIARRSVAAGLLGRGDARATLRLETIPASGEARIRTLEVKAKRGPEEFGRALVRFVSPAEVAGTALLVLGHLDRETDQYLYLPAFKKVKRVAAGDRRGSFMGSDFSFADFEGRKVEDATWQRHDDEVLPSGPAYVLTAIPKAGTSAHGRLRFWVHKDGYVPVRVEFYDEAGKALVRVLTVAHLKTFGDRVLAMESFMQNVAKGSRTRLVVETVDLDTPVADADLTEQALRR